MISNEVMTTKMEQIIQDGYCVIEEILDSKMIKKLRLVSDSIIDQQDETHFIEHASQGCIISVTKHPFMAKLIAYPRTLKIFTDLGFDDPKFMSGYVISKPPEGPPLRWHQDGFWWNHPVSYTAQTQQWFLMYYLVDTTRENGCLRVIPGSHLKRHALHEHIPEYENNIKQFNRVEELNHPLFQKAEGEVDVPVKAGDLVIGDARLFHSAYSNQSKAWRTVLTLWYWPDFNAMPEPIRAMIGSNRHRPAELPESWPHQLTDPLTTEYQGNTKPLKSSRFPTQELK